MSEMMEKNLTPEEKWERATIANNFIFYKVMHNNPEICKELLEILLEMKLDRIEMRQEEEVEIDYGKKGIRMDVYAYGVDKAFNIELQTSDTGELPERARYYQGVLDVDQKDFLRLVLSNECSSGFSNKISKMVEAAKHNTQWRKQFMEFERQMAYSFREGKAEGLVEGKAEAKEEVVVEMLKKDISPELIAECVKLPLEKVLELQEKSNVNA